jgi:RimJ/RimL family protein N-acetyltransferase
MSTPSVFGLGNKLLEIQKLKDVKIEDYWGYTCCPLCQEAVGHCKFSYQNMSWTESESHYLLRHPNLKLTKPGLVSFIQSFYPQIRPFSLQLDDEKRIIQQWSDDLMKIQSDPAGTLRYIARQEDMKNIGKFYNGEQGQFFVAITDDKIPVLIGFAAVGLMKDNQFHLMRINVHPEHRRKGIAKKLAQTAINWWKINKSKEYPVLGATIDKSNLESQALCKSIGFKFVSWYYTDMIQYWTLERE